jgi:hypothetical protein
MRRGVRAGLVEPSPGAPSAAPPPPRLRRPSGREVENGANEKTGAKALTKVYFAGPEVFGPNFAVFVSRVRRLTAEVGLEPLLPGLDDLSAGEAIVALDTPNSST